MILTIFAGTFNAFIFEMEHVPLPSTVKHHSVKIPLFAKDEWDDKDFITYPDRAGWRHALSKRSWSGDPSPFIQTWLFFGLISTICGRKATFGEFTSLDRSGSTILRTASLVNRNKWRMQCNEHGDPTKSDLVKAIICLQEAKHAFFIFAQGNCGYQMDPRLALSISTTGEFLCALVFRNFGHIVPIDTADGPVFSTKFVLRSDTWNVATLTAEQISKSYAKFESFTSNDWAHKNGNSYCCQKMLSKKWCLKKAVRCSTDFNATALYYASYFDKPSPGSDHTDCTSTYCSVTHLNKKTYQTAHINSDCTCEHMRATEADLCSILTKKTFPLIDFSDHLREGANITLQEFRPKTSFVAISHVWSDGMGNPHGNSLPHCQLSRISKSVIQLCGSNDLHLTPFWIDTICCPFQSGDAKNLAILKMRETYASAEWVLVFDEWLMSQNIGGLSDAEILLRIACSNWNERLWTLQEGILAKRIAFQFRDTIYHGSESAIHRIGLDAESSDFCLRATLMNQYDPFHGFNNMEAAEPGTRLLALRDTLKFRGTSVSSDEALCLGSLLGFEMTSIVQAPKEDKMRIFWSNFPQIPTQLVFGGARRLSENGYGWAPETLRHPLAEGPQMLQASFCTPILRSNKPPKPTKHIQGLQIQGPGFLFDISGHRLWNVFRFFDQKGNFYAAEFDPILPGFSFEESYLDLKRPRGYQRHIDAWDRVSEQSTGCVALICVYSPDSEGKFPVEDFYNAILVTVLKQNNGLLHTKFVAPVRISPDKRKQSIDSAQDLVHNSPHKSRPSCVVFEEGNISIIAGARLLENQTWLIL